ncbi:MAG: hypothetical protein ABEH64_11935 [Salinirussus sp.]
MHTIARQMVTLRAVWDLVVLVTTYLLFSLVPFVLLSPHRVSGFRSWIAQNVIYVAFLGTFMLTILSLLVVAWTGVERYVDILRTPTDPLSIVVGATFLMAAVSWWLLPAINQAFAFGLSTEGVILAVVVAHIPVVLFMSLLTVAEAVLRGP